jgi:ketosteroid isomerase-like protein
MKITKSVLAASFLLFSASLVAGRSSLDESAAEKQISGTLHQMYEAEKRKDLSFVLSHLADDFAEVAGDGNVYHRSDIQAGWADVALRDYKLSDCIFKLMTPDAAYLACIMDVDATYKGQPFPQRFRVTTVWTRHKGEWLIRFEQGTIISESKKNSPAKRD